jgi:ribosomal protein L32
MQDVTKTRSTMEAGYSLLSTCPKCGAFRLPHRICPSLLDLYNGREYGKPEKTAK